MIKENIYQIDILFINVVAVTSTIFIMIYSTAVYHPLTIVDFFHLINKFCKGLPKQNW